jgi:hypothetical protein
MVSVKAYSTLVTKFLDKYEALLSKTMVKDISNIYEWVVGFSDALAKGKESQSKLIYMKRGANLMKRFVLQYEKDSADMASNLLQCRQALLGVYGVKLPSWCTEETKTKLLRYALDLRIFTREFIGCADAANEFFLEGLKKAAPFLGDEYVKIKNDMELTCLHLKIEELRN